MLELVGDGHSSVDSLESDIHVFGHGRKSKQNSTLCPESSSFPEAPFRQGSRGYLLDLFPEPCVRDYPLDRTLNKVRSKVEDSTLLSLLYLHIVFFFFLLKTC